MGIEMGKVRRENVFFFFVIWGSEGFDRHVNEFGFILYAEGSH